MEINEIDLGDLTLLKQKARRETNAKQRDRFRAVVMAIEGMTTPAIMDPSPAGSRRQRQSAGRMPAFHSSSLERG
jgi:hypothetical protein